MNADDRRLLRATLAGDRNAYGQLVERYQDRLFNSVLRLVDQPEDAADIVQEAFVAAYGSLKSFGGGSEFFTWLYRIAFNAAMSWRRKRRPVQRIENAAGHEPGIEPDPAEGLVRNEEADMLAKALATLSAEHRAILVLKEIDELRYEEIAEILEIPVGTVRSRLHRARLELHDAVMQLQGEGSKLHQPC